MKMTAIAILIIALYLSSASALNHWVHVYLLEIGGDSGSTVELRTSVRFNLAGAAQYSW